MVSESVYNNTVIHCYCDKKFMINSHYDERNRIHNYLKASMILNFFIFFTVRLIDSVFVIVFFRISYTKRVESITFV